MHPIDPNDKFDPNKNPKLKGLFGGFDQLMDVKPDDSQTDPSDLGNFDLSVPTQLLNGVRATPSARTHNPFGRSSVVGELSDIKNLPGFEKTFPSQVQTSTQADEEGVEADDILPPLPSVKGLDTVMTLEPWPSDNIDPSLIASDLSQYIDPSFWESRPTSGRE